MDGLNHFQRLFAYHEWANRQSLASLVDDVDTQALVLIAHVIASDRLWHARLTGAESPLAVWPELSASECRDQLEEAVGLWTDYLGGLGADDLSLTIAYTNTRGIDFTNTIGDILTHVITHAAYHRGQIASRVRGSGREPAYTDFIECIRQGYVE